MLLAFAVGLWGMAVGRRCTCIIMVSLVAAAKRVCCVGISGYQCWVEVGAGGSVSGGCHGGGMLCGGSKVHVVDLGIAIVWACGDHQLWSCLGVFCIAWTLLHQNLGVVVKNFVP